MASGSRKCLINRNVFLRTTLYHGDTENPEKGALGQKTKSLSPLCLCGKNILS